MSYNNITICLSDDSNSINKKYIFKKPFNVGRSRYCDIKVQSRIVSRTHLAFTPTESNGWQVKDLDSANGTYMNRKRITSAYIKKNTEIQLGKNEGPMLFVSFNGLSSQKKNHGVCLISFICLLFFLFTFILTLNIKNNQREIDIQRKLAKDIFFSIKSLEMEFRKNNSNNNYELNDKNNFNHKYMNKMNSQSVRYKMLLNYISHANKNISEKEKIIGKIMNTFGECELNIPRHFIEAIFDNINKWKNSNRLNKAIKIAQKKGYLNDIEKNLNKYWLPPQLLYIALQESDFDINACGRKTRFGIAKGMWQFLPSTALAYGLKVGPLVHIRKKDPRDERHDFKKSTDAAAKYINDLYNTDAHGSGLLVMASYNWGTGNVLKYLKKMPQKSGYRNYLNLIRQYGNKIPQETKKFVLAVVSAAVICENPQLFGFDFNPLHQIL